MQKTTVSPIKKPLLNLPGQSVQKKIQEFIDDNFVLPAMCLAVLLVLCVVEWIGYLMHAPRTPWIYSTMLVAAAVGFVLHWRGKWPKLLALKLGRDGERAVAEYLDRYLDPTARKFHDVPIAHGNVDHVIICTRGVFAIETKTRSQPHLRAAVVSVAADQLKVDGHTPDRDPIAQIRTGARDLHQVLSGYSKKPFFIRPVVLFPGWSIADHRQVDTEVWILEARELAARLEASPITLTSSDVRRLASRLTRFIRAANEKPEAHVRTAEPD
jgi:hypothetical protein